MSFRFTRNEEIMKSTNHINLSQTDLSLQMLNLFSLFDSGKYDQD